MPYSDERLTVVSAICTNRMGKWIIVVPLIFLKMVKLHCPDWVMQNFDYRQHIPINIGTSDSLHVITCRGKNDDYDWLSRHGAHVA